MSYFDQYLTSLYWGMTTMTTVGYGDISASTSAEKVTSRCAARRPAVVADPRRSPRMPAHTAARQTAPHSRPAGLLHLLHADRWLHVRRHHRLAHQHHR
eukprot:COSAG01_NODE_1441_length_10293_cov_4.232392_10_plen_99_part_00